MVDGSHITQGLLAIVSGFIGVAIVSVLVSRNAQTGQVISSAGGALSSILGVAVSPVTGGGTGTGIGTIGGSGIGFGGTGGGAQMLNLAFDPNQIMNRFNYPGFWGQQPTDTGTADIGSDGGAYLPL